MSTTIYCRVSTDNQNVEQQAAHLMKMHPQFDNIVCESASGRTLDRPKFELLRKRMRSGDKIIVQDMSRIGRNLKSVLEFIEECQQCEVTLIISDLGIDTSTPSGKMTASIIGAVAEMQREQMLEKQRIGIERARSEGKYKGRPSINKNIIDAAKRLQAEGMPIYKVAKHLNISQGSAYKYLA